jgi:hypothetical protein
MIRAVQESSFLLAERALIHFWNKIRNSMCSMDTVWLPPPCTEWRRETWRTTVEYQQERDLRMRSKTERCVTGMAITESTQPWPLRSTNEM